MMILQVAAIVCSGLLVGNEVAVGAFVHPQLVRLDDRAHAGAARALARVYGRAMPPWYALALALAGAVALTIRPARATPSLLAVASAALWLGSIAFTIVGPLPINNAVARWDLDELPPDWKRLRRRWDRLHALRTLLILAALICQVAACLASRDGSPRATGGASPDDQPPFSRTGTP